MNNEVRALVVSGSDLYAGGRFTVAGGKAVRRIARWDGSAWNALGLGMNDQVYALAASGSDVYAGGFFTTAGPTFSTHVAKWAPLAFRANSVTVCNGTFQALLTGPDANTVVVDGTENFTNWIPVATNTLPPGGAWPLSLPTATNLNQFYRARLGP